MEAMERVGKRVVYVDFSNRERIRFEREKRKREPKKPLEAHVKVDARESLMSQKQTMYERKIRECISVLTIANEAFKQRYPKDSTASPNPKDLAECMVIYQNMEAAVKKLVKILYIMNRYCC